MANDKTQLLVEKRVHVSATPDTTFKYFTQAVGQWWPLESHSVSAGALNAAARSCAFEPRQGGELFEITADGGREVWGTVTVWQPPHRLSFTWHPGLPSAEATLVDIRFEGAADGGCELILRHTGWEARGEKAREVWQSYQKGWDPVLLDGFQAHVHAQDG